MGARCIPSCRRGDPSSPSLSSTPEAHRHTQASKITDASLFTRGAADWGFCPPPRVPSVRVAGAGSALSGRHFQLRAPQEELQDAVGQQCQAEVQDQDLGDDQLELWETRGGGCSWMTGWWCPHPQRLLPRPLTSTGMSTRPNWLLRSGEEPSRRPTTASRDKARLQTNGRFSGRLSMKGGPWG